MPSKTGLQGFKYRGVSVTWSPARKRYEGKVTVGKKPDGGYDRRNVNGKDPEAIKTNIRKLQAAVDTKTVRKPGKLQVEPWFREWVTKIAPLDAKRPLREKSQASYLSLLTNWLFKYYGKHDLDALEVTDLDDLYSKMDAAKLSGTTILKMHSIIRRGLTVAKTRGLVTRNVAQLRDNPGSTKPRKRVRLPVDRTEDLLAELDRRPRRIGLRWKIGIAVGSRQGETLGLRWAFVDWRRGGIYVDWQLQRRKWRHGCDDPAACASVHCRREPCPPTWEHGCADETACKGKPAYCPQRREATMIVHGCGGGRRAEHPPERCPQRRRIRRCRLHRREECPPMCPPGCTEHAAQCANPVRGGLVFVRPKALHVSEEDDELHEFVALPPSIMDELRVHQAEQDKHKKAVGKEWRERDLVFCGPFGEPIDPKADFEEIREVLQAIGVDISGTHWSRRLSARLLSNLGFNTTKIGATLRIRDERITKGYIGEDSGDTEETAHAMDEQWFKRANQPLATVTPIRRTVAHRRRRVGR